MSKSGPSVGNRRNNAIRHALRCANQNESSSSAKQSSLAAARLKTNSEPSPRQTPSESRCSPPRNLRDQSATKRPVVYWCTYGFRSTNKGSELGCLDGWENVVGNIRKLFLRGTSKGLNPDASQSCFCISAVLEHSGGRKVATISRSFPRPRSQQRSVL